MVNQHGQQLAQMRTGSLGRNSSLGGEFLHLLASQNMLKLIGASYWVRISLSIHSLDDGESELAAEGIQAEESAPILRLRTHPLAREQRRTYDRQRHGIGAATVSNARAETEALIPRIGGPSVQR